MKEKKTMIIRGNLVVPLMIGGCALLSSGGMFIRTSTVVAVHSCGATQIRFETLNTKYTLILEPTPKTRPTPVNLSVAA